MKTRHIRWKEHDQAVQRIAVRLGIPEAEVIRYLKKIFGGVGVVRVMRRYKAVKLGSYGMLKPGLKRKAREANKVWQRKAAIRRRDRARMK